MKILDPEDRVVEVEEAGVPVLFQPGEWDMAEELENNEALREHQRENSLDD